MTTPGHRTCCRCAVEGMTHDGQCKSRAKGAVRLDGPKSPRRADINSRLALWTRHSHATGRKLGQALRDWSWSGLARRGRP